MGLTTKNSLILILGLGLFTSCQEARDRATEKLNELDEKTMEFNKALDDGLDRIESIDSVVKEGTSQLREVDSLVRNSTSRIDSIAREKTKAWEELTNF